MRDTWEKLNQRIMGCDRCERLRVYGAKVAAEKRKAYRDEVYWGRPVPNFGDASARLLIVGLAPGAHGAHRTGRMFTGDKSGDFLYAAMHAAGFASQPTSVKRDDGLQLIDCAITAACHCAPPGNKPTTGELRACDVHMADTLKLMPNLRGFLALGGIGFDAVLRLYREQGWHVPTPRPKFEHGAIHQWRDNKPFIACTYHPSQQNTFTGRLTMPMLTAVLEKVRGEMDAS